MIAPPKPNVASERRDILISFLLFLVWAARDAKLLELNLQHICANHRSIGAVIGGASICIRRVGPSHRFVGTPLRVISPVMGIVTLTCRGRREDEDRLTVPVMLRFGCTFPGARH
jgi:hypothetical protein